jgi:hypothetical protein
MFLLLADSRTGMALLKLAAPWSASVSVTGDIYVGGIQAHAIIEDNRKRFA